MGQNISVFFILTYRTLSSVGVNQPKAIDCNETADLCLLTSSSLHTGYRRITDYQEPAESGPPKEISHISVQADCNKTRNMRSALRIILNINFFTVSFQRN